MSISEIQRFHTDLTSGAVLRAASSAEAPKRSSQTLASVVHRRGLIDGVAECLLPPRPGPAGKAPPPASCFGSPSRAAWRFAPYRRLLRLFDDRACYSIGARVTASAETAIESRRNGKERDINRRAILTETPMKHGIMASTEWLRFSVAPNDGLGLFINYFNRL